MAAGIGFVSYKAGQMKPTSLQTYFFKNTALVVFAVMLTSVVIFDIVYRNELKQSVYERLKLHIFTLLSVAEFDGANVTLPDISYHPQLNTADSGLWAAVFSQGVNQRMLWRSLSIEQLPSEPPLSDNIGHWHFDETTVKGSHFFTASFKVGLENNKQSAVFNVVVAEDKNTLNESIQNFRFWLLISFIGFTAILLISQIIALRLSFKPIKFLEQEISDLDIGKKDLVSQEYPNELAGVTTKLNGLIKKERDQRNRYRTSMSDLAHSLKTPMAVIHAEISHYQDNATLKNAINRIDNSIEYQLRRAVIGGHNIVSAGVKLFDIIQLIKEALDKIYIHKNINLNIEIPSDSQFMGDENDLMEIMGNLMDNAYKFAKNKILVSASLTSKELIISIEDDGEGLNETAQSTIFNRGERMDEKQLGQGIGLAVVADIVNSYEGKITTGASALGGALFMIHFPYENTNNG